MGIWFSLTLMLIFFFFLQALGIHGCILHLSYILLLQKRREKYKRSVKLVKQRSVTEISSTSPAHPPFMMAKQHLPSLPTVLPDGAVEISGEIQ